MKITYYEYLTNVISGEIKIQIIILEKSPYTSTTYIDAHEKGIRITNISDIELATNRDNPVLFPANVTLDFVDTNFELYNKLVNGSLEDVECRIFKNNKTEFYGTMVNDLDEGYLCDYGEKEVQIEFATPTNKLKEKRFFDIDDNYIQENDLGAEDRLINILNNILVKSGFSGNVQLKHDWIYQGESVHTNNYIYNIKTSDLKVRLQYVISEDHNMFEVRTYDDLLKALVFSLGGYMSFADYSRPIFRSLIYQNEILAPQTNQIMYIKRKKIASKELVRINPKFQILSTEGLDISEWFYNSVENYKGSEENAFIKEVLFPIEEERNARELFVNLDSSHIVNLVKNQINGAWEPNGKVLLDIWTKIVSSWNNGALEIGLVGDHYEFYNSIKIDGKEFMIESMKKSLVKNETIIEAFPI